MKTTLEIPDAIFRRAKSAAAERGIPLRELGTEAVKEKLAQTRRPTQQPWMTAFGKLRRLRKETAKINRMIEQEFERVEPEDQVWDFTVSEPRSLRAVACRVPADLSNPGRR